MVLDVVECDATHAEVERRLVSEWPELIRGSKAASSNRAELRTEVRLRAVCVHQCVSEFGRDEYRMTESPSVVGRPRHGDPNRGGHSGREPREPRAPWSTARKEYERHQQEDDQQRLF